MTLAEIIADLQIDLPGVQENMAGRAVRAALSDFCRQSQAFEYTCTLDAVEEQANYQLLFGVASGDYSLLSIRSVELDDEEMDPSTFTVNLRTQVLTFEDAYIPSEDSTGGLVVVASVEPTRDLATATIASTATLLDFIDRYSHGIYHGARARLCRQQRRPWSDPRDAAESEQAFRDAISDAQGDYILQGHQDITASVQFVL